MNNTGNIMFDIKSSVRKCLCLIGMNEDEDSMNACEEMESILEAIDKAEEGERK